MKILLKYLFLPFLFSFAKENLKGETSIEEEKYGVKYASRCEVCKLVVRELEDKLKETGKSHDVIETGYALDDKARKKTKYVKSELRLLESLENVCERILSYNVHKERKDSTRFEKGMSTTFKVLHGLVDKGVKVDLGIPYELWDKPSAEITHMKTQCELLIENHESDVENWYYHHQDIPLKKYLCEQRALSRDEISCLDEVWTGDKEDKDDEESEDDSSIKDAPKPKKDKTKSSNERKVSSKKAKKKKEKSEL